MLAFLFLLSYYIYRKEKLCHLTNISQSLSLIKKQLAWILTLPYLTLPYLQGEQPANKSLSAETVADIDTV